MPTGKVYVADADTVVCGVSVEAIRIFPSPGYPGFTQCDSDNNHINRI